MTYSRRKECKANTYPNLIFLTTRFFLLSRYKSPVLQNSFLTSLYKAPIKKYLFKSLWRTNYKKGIWILIPRYLQIVSCLFGFNRGVKRFLYNPIYYITKVTILKLLFKMVHLYTESYRRIEEKWIFVFRKNLVYFSYFFMLRNINYMI